MLKWYEERKQILEARKYFRSNNNEIPTSLDFVKTICISFVVSLIGGLLIMYIANLFGFTSLLFYFFVAFVLVKAVKFYVNKSTDSIVVLSIVTFILGLITGVSFYYLNLMGGLGFISLGWIIDLSISYFISGSIFNLIGIVLSVCFIYNGLKN